MPHASRLLLLWLGVSLSATGFAATQQEILDPEMRALHARAVSTYHAQHDRAGGLALAKELETLAASRRNNYWHSSGLWKQAQILNDDGNVAESIRLYEKALAVATRDADYAGTANHLILLGNLFVGYENRGQRGESLRIHQALIPAAGLNLSGTSELPADTPLFELSDEDLRRIPVIAFISTLYVAEIKLRFESGDDAGALALAEKMDRRLAGTTNGWEVTRYVVILAHLVDIHLASGRTTEAEQVLLRLLAQPRVPKSEIFDDILSARIDLALLRARRGEDPVPLLVEVQASLDEMAKHRWTSRRLAGLGKLASLRALAGDFPGACRLIDATIEEARSLDTPRLLAELLLTRVDLHLSAGSTEGVLSDLFAALGWYRRQGGLRAETAAMVHYARYLRMSGQTDKARVALARAEIALRRFPDAALRARLIEENAAWAAAPAPRGSVPAGDASRIAAGDLQPVELTTRIPPSRMGRARFTLVNPGSVPVSGVLEAQGIALDATWDAPALQWRLHVGETATRTEATQPVTLQPLDLATIVLTVAPSLAAEGKVRLTWRGEGEPQSAWWSFARGETGTEVAVIDANLALENPFYSVPLHHHLVRPDAGADLSQNLRVVADQPCRVELVAAESGRVLAVDASGDGDFRGVGDVIFADADRDGFPDLRFEKDKSEATLEIQVYPLSRYEEVGVRLELRTRDGAWTPGATDRLLGKP